MTKVLVLGAGGAASNGFARALRLAGGYELVGTNCNENDLWLSECETNHPIAPVTDYDAWRGDIFDVIKKEKPDFVHAQNDAEVEALGRIRTLVHTAGAKTYLPTSTTIELCRDKWRSYKRWRDYGITVPYTRLAESPLDITSALRDGPIWLRPRIGAGGQQSCRTDHASVAYDLLRRNDGWGDFTVAEVLTPDTVTVQQLYWKGELVCSQQRTRKSWANAGSTTTGVSGSTGVGVTSSYVEADRVADLAVQAIDKKPHGLYGIDMAYNKAGTPCPTEINIGRFFTTMPEFMAMAARAIDPSPPVWDSKIRRMNMADYFVSLSEFHPSEMPFYAEGKTANRNPIPDGFKWIRGMDKLPVLVPA